MKHAPRPLLVLVGSASLFLSISSCGGGGGSSGGGGGTTPGVATPAATVVSGTVTAPGTGAIAFFKQPSLGDPFVSEAYAALTGLVNVADTTVVQLARLNATGTNFTVLATTTTSGGRYSFNLTALGLQPSNDLIVRVAGSGGAQMRAFVVGTVADLNPISEAVCQLAIQSLNGNTMSNLTLQEVADISGAVGLISALRNIGNATQVDQAVGLVKTAVGADVQVSGFIAAAAGAGQTTQGTGDVGNYFPFEQGSIWRYKGTRVTSGSPSIGYDTNVLVSGQESAPINGINSTVFSETNNQGENRAEKSYSIKGVSGITSYGNDDPTDDLSRQLAPFQSVHFPLTLGATTILIERTGLDWGDDEDGDGRNETFTVTISQTVAGMESITVPAQTFPNSLRIDTRALFLVSFTRGGSGTVVQTDTAWHVSGVGRVKEVVQAQIDGGPVLASLTEELAGYVVNGQGSGLRIEVSPSSVSLSEGQNLQLQAKAFDQNNNIISGVPFAWVSNDPTIANVSQAGLVTANTMGTTRISVSGGSNQVPITVSNVRIIQVATNDLVYDKFSGKLYASMPGSQGSIIAIDPATGLPGQPVVVGSDPNKLAISDNGQYLYVSLDDASSIRRMSLPTLTTDLNFSLGTHPPSTPQEYICGKDIQVVPGNAREVVVARARHIGSGSCRFNDAYEAAVFQDGVELPNKTSGQGPAFVHLLEFSDSASLLYGLSTFSPGTLSRISVTASGLTFVDFSLLPNWPGRDFKHLNGLIYMASGDAINASTYSVVGSFTANGQSAGATSLRPDSSTQRLFIVTGGSTDSVATVRAFDLNGLTALGSLDVSNLGTPAVPQFTRYTSLVRWGSNGLAFRTSSNEVVIIRSPLVQP
jgi:Bacterial Ig-like domain (group 2)